MHLDAGMQGSWMHRLKSQQGPGKACRGSSPTCLMHKPSEMAMKSIESSSGSSISCDASCGAKDSTSLRQTLLGTLLGPTVSGTWLLSNRQGHSRRQQCHRRLPRSLITASLQAMCQHGLAGRHIAAPSRHMWTEPWK